MAKKDDNRLVVGLDIGTSKVLAIVGEVGATGEVEVIGVGHHPSRGMRRGVVVNIESTVQSIQRAVEEAELMAGCQIHSVYAGIAGSHIASINSHGIVAIKDKEVGPGDVERVIEAARAVAMPADQKILHILPQEFIIDKQDGIREPIGMSGVRLEAKVHIVTGAVSAAQNIIKCVRRCGLEVDDVILEQLASSTSTLTDDEKELGVCLVDIAAVISGIGEASLSSSHVPARVDESSPFLWASVSGRMRGIEVLHECSQRASASASYGPGLRPLVRGTARSPGVIAENLRRSTRRRASALLLVAARVMAAALHRAGAGAGQSLLSCVGNAAG